MIRWGHVHGSVSAQVFPVGVPEKELGQNDEPVLPIRQPDTHDVHLVAVPGGVAVVAGCLHHHAAVWSEALHAFRWPAFPCRCSHKRFRQTRVDAYRGSDLARVRYRLRQSGILNLYALFSLFK